MSQLITRLLAREFPNREARRRATPEEIAYVAWRDGFVNGVKKERALRRHLHAQRLYRMGFWLP